MTLRMEWGKALSFNHELFSVLSFFTNARSAATQWMAIRYIPEVRSLMKL